MNWLDDLRGLKRTPTKGEIVAAHTMQIEAEHDKVVRKMADDLLAGAADWSNPVMRVEIGLATRMTHEAMALAVKQLSQGQRQ